MYLQIMLGFFYYYSTSTYPVHINIDKVIMFVSKFCDVIQQVFNIFWILFVQIKNFPEPGS